MNNTKANNEKQRNVTLDYFRIMIMYMIVLGHSLVHTSILYRTQRYTFNYYIVSVLFCFIIVHVNCFVLLSGYLGYSKRFSYKKVLRLWTQVLFWSVTLYVGINLLEKNTIQIKELIKCCMPITQQKYWFMTTYILMYLLTPLMNAAIAHMNRKQHRLVLLNYFIIFILVQNLLFYKEFTNVEFSNPLFFCFLYMLGAYIAKYPTTKKIWWLFMYVFISALSAGYRIGITWMTEHYCGRIEGVDIFKDYTSVLTVVGALALTLFFARMRIKSGAIMSKLLAHISTATLGVYLIHDNDYVRVWMWQKLNLLSLSDDKHMIFVLIAVSIGIFIICICLEEIRMILFNKLKINKILDCLGEKIDYKINL